MKWTKELWLTIIKGPRCPICPHGRLKKTTLFDYETESMIWECDHCKKEFV